jgi:hypothetical protein
MQVVVVTLVFCEGLRCLVERVEVKLIHMVMERYQLVKQNMVQFKLRQVALGFQVQLTTTIYQAVLHQEVPFQHTIQ